MSAAPCGEMSAGLRVPTTATHREDVNRPNTLPLEVHYGEPVRLINRVSCLLLACNKCGYDAFLLALALFLLLVCCT